MAPGILNSQEIKSEYNLKITVNKLIFHNISCVGNQERTTTVKASP